LQASLKYHATHLILLKAHLTLGLKNVLSPILLGSITVKICHLAVFPAFQIDARNIGASRSSGSVDKTRDISKITNRSSGEEKPSGLTANNSWEKPKMKKRRSVIKTDASSTASLTRSVDGDREKKQEVVPKLGGDARPKVTAPHSSR
jgi:hypothetical protein